MRVSELDCRMSIISSIWNKKPEIGFSQCNISYLLYSEVFQDAVRK